MLADLYNAPGETTGARTQGSSEAIMLGALSLKWKWRERREAAGKATDKPNLVFGGDVHVVWEKFCRYFDVEPRIVPLQPHKFTIGPEDVEPHVDENTIGVAAVLGTTFTGHSDDIVGINDFLVALKNDKGVDVPLHVDAASGGFVWPFLYPHTEWDFRLEQVRSINVSGHKFGMVYPGIGWLIFREKTDLAEDLVFYENYLGKTDATFTLNFSTGASMVLAQYYNLIRFGHDGYTFVMDVMKKNADYLAKRLEDLGPFEVIGADEEQLPLVAFRIREDADLPYDEFDIAWQVAAERGWMLPAYTMPPKAESVKMLRALVKLNLNRSLVDALATDIADACDTLEKKGGASKSERAEGQDRRRLLTLSHGHRGVGGLRQQDDRPDQEAERADGGAEVGGSEGEHVPGRRDHVGGDRGDPEGDAAEQVDDRHPPLLGVLPPPAVGAARGHVGEVAGDEEADRAVDVGPPDEAVDGTACRANPGARHAC